MARPSGWDILGLDGDPTPGVVESVQALAKEFGDFAHDVEAAYRSLNSFGSDAAAMQWVGQTADSFKGQYGPLPGRLQKLYTSYSEASDALSAYWPQLQAAQSKADAALRQAQDANADLQRATTNANTAAADLKTAQQNHAANPNPQSVTDAQTAHDTAQTNLNNAKTAMAALTKQANDAYHDRITAAKVCARAIGHAQSDGIHNKSWWDHVAEDLSKWGGEIADIANELAPFLDVLALATSWIPGVDVVTAALAEADNIIAMVGTGMEVVGDAMQGHWGDALMGAGMLGLTLVGGKAIEKFGGAALGKLAGKFGKEAEGGAEDAVGAEARTAEGNGPAVCKDDPIDVVSGWMLTDETDLTLSGVLPVVLRRAYCSGYTTGRLFGAGWSSTLDQRISINEAGIHFAGEDAQRLDYPADGAESEVLPQRGVRWPLTWDRDSDEVRITDPWAGVTRHFATVHYQDEFGQIRDLTSITDRNGNRINILRDEAGTPTRVEHPAYTIAVDSVATAVGPRVTELRLMNGSDRGVTVKKFSYDQRGRLVGILNSSGQPFTYEWDDTDRIVSWTDRLGYRYGYEYDSSGRVVRTSGTGGFLSGEFAYDPQNRTTVHTDSLGNTTTFRYGVSGHVEAEINSLGHAIQSDMDDYGRLLARVDALGRRTQFELNANGDTVRITDPDGAQTTVEYNSLHQVVAAHMPDGSVWRCEYDERGNPVRLTDATGVATRYHYAPSGAVVEIVDALGSSIHYVCDAAGLYLRMTDSLNATTLAERDAFGRIVSVTDPLGARSHFEWSVEGHLVRQVQPDNTQRTWTHDAEGNITAVVEPAGGRSSFEFGPLGRMTARTGPDGARFTFDYDTALNLRSVNHPTGASWTYTYDPAGNLTGETDFIGASQQYDYDPVGGVIAVTNRLGQRTTFERDSMGRVVQAECPEGDYSYSYDLAGRLIAAAGPDSSIEFCRDVVGRVVRETVDGRSVHFEYDVAGRRTRRITPSGAVSEWTYDATGRPAALAAGAGSMRFEFDSAGREVARLFGDDVWLSRTVDPLGRVTNERLWSGDRRREHGDRAAAAEPQLVLDRSWMWSTDSLPTAIADSLTGSRRFATDNVGRVTAVTAEAWNETYAYDGFGNLSTGTIGDDAVAAETDRTLTRRMGRVAYDHDAAGRVVRVIRRTLDGRRRTWTYEWDSSDRLAQIETADGRVWRYSYDPLGRRIGKALVEADGRVTEQVAFTWDGPRIAEQRTVGHEAEDAVAVWDYDPSTANPVAQRLYNLAGNGDSGPGSELFYAVITDAIGTPTELVTPEGRIAWRTTASLWGRTRTVVADPGIDCPLRFPGQYFDNESGLHYNVHRYYDPDTAAFLTPDPLGLAPAPNDHSYVGNPLIHTDPLGLMCPQAAGNNAPQPPESNVINLPEVKDPKPRKPGEAVKEWEDFLGPGPYNNIHPRTGMPDPDRLFSADGTRSIRMGNHEMGSKPTKFHFHKETWDWISPSNTWVVGNTMVRVPLGVK